MKWSSQQRIMISKRYFKRKVTLATDADLFPVNRSKRQEEDQKVYKIIINGSKVKFQSIQ